ncbi:MAG: TonB-dependent receptor [Bacteroidetes bacterium]|jgi:iron complex outermembrane receptor protein|nr:TonB-dependent receptor [Bacteroidota bacterium]
MKRFYIFLALVMSCLNGISQQVSGVVLNKQSGEPLIGANVYYSETGNGTVTNAEGYFSMNVPRSAEHITISHVGFKTKKIAISDTVKAYLAPAVDLEQVIIQAVRAGDQDPVTQSTVERKELENVYNGEQPIFFLEDLTPSIISYSESGTKLANYGSMRLRGIGQERINMTLNGVPLNDMIDHGVFFSNFTDIGNSFESVQVQRGVGTSSNGVASYAGSINFESVNIEDREQGGQLELGLGSFNTYRLNSSLSSGMIDDKWSFYGSYSRIASDGFKDNTGTNAYSFFFSGGYFGEKDMFKINAFDARSKNGLGYNSEPESVLKKDITANSLNENDQDDFGQRLIQLQHTHIFNDLFSTNASLYYGGASGDFLYTYQHPDDTTALAQINYPLINDHYGLMVNGFLNYGQWEISVGTHGYIFKRVNEESFTPDFANPYYFETSDKKEVSWFGKVQWTNSTWRIYADAQMRQMNLSIHPDYDAPGMEGVEPEGEITRNRTFINPNIGASYSFSDHLSVYASLGRMGREPTRIDILGGFSLSAANFEFAQSDAFKPEYVNDLEAGIKWNSQMLAVNTNFFYMDFENEIAPIGEVLAFGLQKRRNIPNSYRTGVEMEWNYLPVRFIGFQGNLTYMQSEIETFTSGTGETYNNKTPILSPEIIGRGRINIFPAENLSVRFSGNYVGQSFLELTNDPEFTLPAYFTMDAAIAYELGSISIRLEAKNLSDQHYYTNGSPLDLDFDGTNDEPGYIVNAGRNYFLSTTFKF